MVHKYLRSIGFSDIKSKEEMQNLIKDCIHDAGEKSYTTVDDDILYAEYKTEFADRIGLCVRGEYDENNKFIYDHSFPFLRGRGISSEEDISVERHIEKMSFAGVIDDFKIGISLIFYLQNIITYLKYSNTNRLPLKGTSITFSGLSTQGTILMPIQKDEAQIKNSYRYNMRKSRMLQEAVNGNEKAIENLTIQDMDTINYVQKKVKDEDIYTLVETYFMPYGVECDLYSIMGEITYCEMVTNSYTGEDVYILTLDVNDVSIDVCINKKDVIGEAMAGRRFKGTIWLQGFINFPEDI